MTQTLLAMNLLNSQLGFIVAGFIGFFFGFFLEKAGFGSSRKLTGIFYFRDMSVLKVMFTAVITALIGIQYLNVKGWIDPNGIHILETYWGPQIVGGLIFGAGFVIGGWCPGTAYVGLASGKIDALVFLIGAGLGSVFFNEIYRYIEPFYTATWSGPLFLWDSLRIPKNLLIFLFCAFAVFAFWGSTWLEKRYGHIEKPKIPMRFGHGFAGLILICLAAGLFFFKIPTIESPVKISSYLEQVAEAEDHIDPMELAEIMMKGTTSLYLVDIRPSEDYEKFHLKDAVNIPLAELDSVADDALPTEGITVLYSNGTTHAAQAWLELRHRGRENVFVLTDGILGFWRECLTPPSLMKNVDPIVTKHAHKTFKDRYDFFLGETGKKHK